MILGNEFWVLDCEGEYLLRLAKRYVLCEGIQRECKGVFVSIFSIL